MNIKRYIALFALIGSITLARGQADQVYLTNNMAVGIATIATAPGVLKEMTAWTTNTSPTLIYLYDNWYLNTNAAWTNYVVYTTNVVYSNVTSTGITNTWTNTMIKTAASIHAAIAGDVSTPIVTLVVPPAAGGVINPITFDDSFVFGKRLTLSNGATGLSLMARYRLQ